MNLSLPLLVLLKDATKHWSLEALQCIEASKRKLEWSLLLLFTLGLYLFVYVCLSLFIWVLICVYICLFLCVCQFCFFLSFLFFLSLGCILPRFLLLSFLTSFFYLLLIFRKDLGDCIFNTTITATTISIIIVVVILQSAALTDHTSFKFFQCSSRFSYSHHYH